MKRRLMRSSYLLVLLMAVMMGAMSCASGNGGQTGAVTDSSAMPEIKFDTAVFNFGRILQGEQVSYVFRFQNTGKSDLVIHKVETSCGCTVPEFDKSPVKPGEFGSIRVRFDSDGKSGTQYKTVKVMSNCKDNIFDLVVTGQVEER